MKELIMSITPELIAFYKKELQIQNDFEPNEEVIASHLLFEQWEQKTQKFKLPKVIFYIIMDEIYGYCYEKDKNNNLGRRLKLKY